MNVRAPSTVVSCRAVPDFWTAAYIALGCTSWPSSPTRDSASRLAARAWASRPAHPANIAALMIGAKSPGSVTPLNLHQVPRCEPAPGWPAIRPGRFRPFRPRQRNSIVLVVGDYRLELHGQRTSSLLGRQRMNLANAGEHAVRGGRLGTGGDRPFQCDGARRRPHREAGDLRPSDSGSIDSSRARRSRRWNREPLLAAAPLAMMLPRSRTRRSGSGPAIRTASAP